VDVGVGDDAVDAIEPAVIGDQRRRIEGGQQRAAGALQVGDEAVAEATVDQAAQRADRQVGRAEVAVRVEVWDRGQGVEHGLERPAEDRQLRAARDGLVEAPRPGP
jgi:hypothetical protein